MKHLIFGMLLAAATTGLTPETGSALDASGRDTAQATMRVFGETRPPIGYLAFCRRQAGECDATAPQAPRPRLDARRWQELDAVNATVNMTVAPVTDLDLYKTVEYWTYPDGSGDCEDYVLAKRRMLLERGWPASALLVTVVRDEEGLGHAVLTVTTDRGDFILDNKTSEIRDWRETPYLYQKRQSASDPLRWVSLGGNDGLRLNPGDPVAAR